MKDQLQEALTEVAPQAVAEIKNYFQSTDANSQKKADVALRVLGRVNGDTSNRLKAVALQLQIARNMGIRGESLRPLLQEINPSFASAASAPVVIPAEMPHSQEAAMLASGPAVLEDAGSKQSTLDVSHGGADVTARKRSGKPKRGL